MTTRIHVSSPLIGRRRKHLCAAFVAVLLGVLALAPGADAATSPAKIRVLTSDGTTLADWRQHAGSVRVRASEKAECFFSPSSNSGYRLKGANQLSLLRHAAAHRRALRPLLVTDSSKDAFGLGVCGIGGFVAPAAFPASFWYVSMNETAGTTAVDETPVGPGDRVTFYFTQGSESGFPDALVLRAPARAKVGEPMEVSVNVAAAADGARSPASGASVAGEVTDVSGSATIVPAQTGRLRLQAFRGLDIPSRILGVCIYDVARECDRHRGQRIFGTRLRDRPRGTPGDDLIRTFGGSDRIRIGNGGNDLVRCGGGFDVVRKKRGDGRDRFRGCERIVRV